MARHAATSDTDTTERQEAPTGADLERALESHRRELTGYCYRMLGSGSEAEDAVQETMVRAWRSIDGFEGRSSLRSWLYRIANNVCIDMLRSPQRRARPMEMGPSSSVAEAVLGEPHAEHTFVQPIADERVIALDGDPADVAAARESIRLAFVAALQHLPARQRAVLILCEVLRWQATEVAELLDTSVASVNSALQRARATLAAAPGRAPRRHRSTPSTQALLDRYVDAFERYDIPALVGLLRDDVVLSMPPYDLWLRGPGQPGRLVPRRGHRVQGRPAAPRVGQRHRRVRQLPPRPPGRVGAVGDPGHRGGRRPHRRPPQLPLPRAVRRVRPAAPHRGAAGN